MSALHAIIKIDSTIQRNENTGLMEGIIYEDTMVGIIKKEQGCLSSGNMPQYFAIEEKLQSVIYDRFGLGDLSDEERKQIENVDDTLLHYEFEELMDFPIFETQPELATKHDFTQKDFTSVEKEFISVFNRLTHKQVQFKCIGIDGCKGGWVVVSIFNSGFEIKIIESISEVLNHNGCDSVLVDMPIGLPQTVRKPS